MRVKHYLVKKAVCDFGRAPSETEPDSGRIGGPRVEISAIRWGPPLGYLAKRVAKVVLRIHLIEVFLTAENHSIESKSWTDSHSVDQAMRICCSTKKKIRGRFEERNWMMMRCLAHKKEDVEIGQTLLIFFLRNGSVNSLRHESSAAFIHTYFHGFPEIFIYYFSV